MSKELEKILVTIYDLFIAADLWRRTSIRPQLNFDKHRNRVVFQWPDSPEIQHAIESNAKDMKIRQFTELYKSLRSELHIMKSGNGGRDE